MTIIAFSLLLSFVFCQTSHFEVCLSNDYCNEQEICAGLTRDAIIGVCLPLRILGPPYSPDISNDYYQPYPANSPLYDAKNFQKYVGKLDQNNFPSQPGDLELSKEETYLNGNKIGEPTEDILVPLDSSARNKISSSYLSNHNYMLDNQINNPDLYNAYDSESDVLDQINRKVGQLKRLDEPKKGINLFQNSLDETDSILPSKQHPGKTFQQTRSSGGIAVGQSSHLLLNDLDDHDRSPVFKGETAGGGQKRRNLKPNIEPDDKRFDIIRSDYAYIKLDHDLKDQSIAYRMLSELAKSLKLQLNTFSDIKIKGPYVMFRVNPNLKSINASTVALKIKIFKSNLEKNLNNGIHILSSGIGEISKTHIRHPIWDGSDSNADLPSYLYPIIDESRTAVKRTFKHFIDEGNGDDVNQGGSDSFDSQENDVDILQQPPRFLVSSRADSGNFEALQGGIQTETGEEIGRPFFEPSSKVLLLTASFLAVFMTIVVAAVLFLMISRRRSSSKDKGQSASSSSDDYEKYLITPTGDNTGEPRNDGSAKSKIGSVKNTANPSNALESSSEMPLSSKRYTSPKWAVQPVGNNSNTTNLKNCNNTGVAKNVNRSNTKGDTNQFSSQPGFLSGLASLFSKTPEDPKVSTSKTYTEKSSPNEGSFTSPIGPTGNVAMNGSDSYVSGSPSFLLNGFGAYNKIGSRRGTWFEDSIFNKMDSATGHIVLEYMEKRIENRQLIDQEWDDNLCQYVPAPFTELEGNVCDVDSPATIPYTESELADPVIQVGILRRSWVSLFENKLIGPEIGFTLPTLMPSVDVTSSLAIKKPLIVVDIFSPFEKSENLAKLTDKTNAPWGVLPYLHNCVHLKWTNADNQKNSLDSKRRKKSSVNSQKAGDSGVLDAETTAKTEDGIPDVQSFKFINASLVTESDPRHPSYVASQGPVNLDLACDFWQMVWDQGIFIIVNLVSNEEYESAIGNNFSKVFKYWPDKGVKIYSIYEVYLVSEHVWSPDYIVRSFYLKNLATNDTRTLTLFHYTAWNSDTIPKDTKSFLEFRRKVNKSYKGRSTPIIVHCSDGSGRTGTYILIDMILTRLCKGAKQIDIEASVEFLRDQRMKMVATKEQFEFSFLAISDEVQNILQALYPTPTPPPASSQNSHINNNNNSIYGNSR